MAMEEMSFRPMNSINMLDQQFSVDIRESSVNFLHSEELDSPTDELVVKVRKPYTITKQREKWTEEEHEKFLEAIKLYGRAWRRIKEHIGTKTAIQIRSHAQKFFSKVLNEPITAKAIEIPPPRPKRKPLHPYPRKMAQACPKRLSVVVQRDESSWVRIPSVPDQENESPVSVLSAVGSDFMLSPVSDPTSHRTLATSSTVRGDPDEPALDSGYCSPTVSSIEDDRTLSPEGAFNMSMKQNETRMELDLHSEDGILQEEVALLRQSASFKLFGNIVSVTDSSDCRNESSCFAGNPECLSSSSASNNESTPLDMQAQVCTHSSTEEPARVVSHPTAESRWVDGASPVYYFLVPNCESLVPIAPLPVWWSPYSDSTLGPCNTINMGLKKEHPDMARNSDDECSEKEDSSTGSNSNSSTQGSGNESPKCIAESAHTFKLNHSANSAFRPVRAISDSPAKVFFLP